VKGMVLVRFLSRRQHTLGLSGEDGDHAGERLIGAGSRLFRRQCGERMSDLDRPIIGTAKRFGVLTGGIHEGLGAQENRWNTTILQG
jgi:hypothetical protein